MKVNIMHDGDRVNLLFKVFPIHSAIDHDEPSGRELVVQSLDDSVSLSTRYIEQFRNFVCLYKLTSVR